MSDKCRVWAVTVSHCHRVSSWPGGGMTPPFTLSDFEVQVSGGAGTAQAANYCQINVPLGKVK